MYFHRMGGDYRLAQSKLISSTPWEIPYHLHNFGNAGVKPWRSSFTLVSDLDYKSPFLYWTTNIFTGNFICRNSTTQTNTHKNDSFSPLSLSYLQSLCCSLSKFSPSYSNIIYFLPTYLNDSLLSLQIYFAQSRFLGLTASFFSLPL